MFVVNASLKKKHKPSCSFNNNKSNDSNQRQLAFSCPIQPAQPNQQVIQKSDHDVSIASNIEHVPAAAPQLVKEHLQLPALPDPVDDNLFRAMMKEAWSFFNSKIKARLPSIDSKTRSVDCSSNFTFPDPKTVSHIHPMFRDTSGKLLQLHFYLKRFTSIEVWDPFRFYPHLIDRNSVLVCQKNHPLQYDGFHEHYIKFGISFDGRIIFVIPALLRCSICEKANKSQDKPGDKSIYHYSTDSEHILSKLPPYVRTDFPLVRGRDRGAISLDFIEVALSLRLGAHATVSSIHFAHRECIANKLTRCSIAAFSLIATLNEKKENNLVPIKFNQKLTPLLFEKDHEIAVSEARISRYCLLELKRQEMYFKASFKKIFYRVIRCDHTFKVASHIFSKHENGSGRTKSENPFSALVTTMNENQLVGYFAFVSTKSMKEIEPHLMALLRRDTNNRTQSVIIDNPS